MSRRRIWIVESGEYSDYRVHAAFESEEDARRAVEAGLGGGGYDGGTVSEFVMFADGEIPRKTQYWNAVAEIGGLNREPGYAWPDEEWDDTEVEPKPLRRPEVTVTRPAGDRVNIRVKARTKEAALKACADRYAKLRAEREGL